MICFYGAQNLTAAPPVQGINLVLCAVYKQLTGLTRHKALKVLKSRCETSGEVSVSMLY